LTDRPPVLLLQHIGCEPMAAYGEELSARGLTVRTVRPDEGEPLPDWRQYAAIVAMGGPMGTYDEASHPWLRDEKAWIAEAVRAGKPYWGVCLGAQLLAASVGASVAPGEVPEVGVLPVRLTEAALADPVFAGAPTTFAALQWHSDTYELPRGAVRLAESAAYREQAYVLGAAYGLQFHLEVTPELAASWIDVPAYAESLEGVLGPGASAQLLRELEGAAGTATALARELFGRWLEIVVGIAPRRPQTRALSR